MSAALATTYVRRMAARETRGFGDDENALRRLEQKFGLPFWTLRYLKHGRAKTIDADIFSRIRGAYLSYCEREIAALQHELAIEKATNTDADIRDLEAEAKKLATKIAKAKSVRLNKRGRG